MSELFTEFIVNDDLNSNNLSKRTFWHYTTYDSLEKIITNHTFRLQKISNTNDTEEKERLKEKGKNPYITCFCNTQAERVSMWLLYAGLDEGVAIGIKPTIMKEMLSNCRLIAYINNDKKIILDNNEYDIKYNWILYKTKDNKKFKYRNDYEDNNGNYEECIFIKDIPWEYEQEFRIAVELKCDKNDNYKYIDLEFNESLIKDIKVRLSPSLTKEKIKTIKKDLIEKGIQSSNIDESIIKFNFDIFSKNKNAFLEYLKILQESNDKEDIEFINSVKEIIKRR